MPEHVHEWSVDHQIIETDDGPPQPRGECFAYCGCGQELRMDDIRHRLNAVERLNADQASTLSAGILFEDVLGPDKETRIAAAAAAAYAAVLEKD